MLFLWQIIPVENTFIYSKIHVATGKWPFFNFMTHLQYKFFPIISHPVSFSFHLFILWHFFTLYVDMDFWSTSFPFSWRNFLKPFLQGNSTGNEFAHFYLSDKVIICLSFLKDFYWIWAFRLVFSFLLLTLSPLHPLPPFIASDKKSGVILIFFSSIGKVWPSPSPVSLQLLFVFGYQRFEYYMPRFCNFC